jgi:peroxiredoxin
MGGCRFFFAAVTPRAFDIGGGSQAAASGRARVEGGGLALTVGSRGRRPEVMTKPVPARPAPALEVDTVAHGRWTLADERPESFTLLVFYRGKHCGKCKTYLQTLTRLAQHLRELGVVFAALSMDDRSTAADTAVEWNLGDFPLGYALTQEQAEAWGLYLSTSIADDEPRSFSEPGLFLVDSAGELYYAAICSAQFGRPDLDEVADAIASIIERCQPARGTAA